MWIIKIINIGDINNRELKKKKEKNELCEL